MHREIYSLLKSKTFILVLIFLLLLSIAGAVAGSILVNRFVQTLGLPNDRILLNAAGQITSYMLFIIALLPHIVINWGFATPGMIKERSTGNLEVLIGSGLSPVQIQCGKTGAITLLATGSSLLCTLLFTGICKIWFFTGYQANIPIYHLQLCLHIVFLHPLLWTGFTGLSIHLAMTRDPDIALLPSLVFGFVLMGGIPAGMGLQWIRLHSWLPVLVSAVMSLMTFIIWIGAGLRTTRERIIARIRI